MRHLIVCPEYPPAPIAAGGIGTYVDNISRLLAISGETVHVVSVRWSGAPKAREELHGGRLIIHRLALDRPLDVAWNEETLPQDELDGLAWSEFPSQSFSWQAALFAEVLVESEGIDVIESQEYDAPLYHFQTRRALGYGPSRQPPCIVHLHSPTELIVKFNGWDAREPRFVLAKRMEAFSIRAADAIVCPSHYLARHAEALYGLESGSVEVIRLPTGDTQPLRRNADIWAKGSISYVGRLEPRKGVIEWVDAAVGVADDYPSARFEFAGADLSFVPGLGVREYVERRIPNRLKSRFDFHGQLARGGLREMLGRSRIAVVPSRWENFPNTCVEAMCTGLPVIASRNGGMAEMVEDEHSGWLAPTQDAAGLRSALRRALEAPSLDLATMGRQATRAIRELCDNERILEMHLEFRSRVAGKSRRATDEGLAPNAGPRSVRSTNERHSTGVIVAAVSAHNLLEECLDRLRLQSRHPADVIAVINEEWDDDAKLAAQKARTNGWRVLTYKGASKAGAWKAGLDAIDGSGVGPKSYLLIDETDRLLPKFLERCEDALCHMPNAGIVTAWRRENGRLIARPHASLPYSLVYNEFESPLLVRAEALHAAGFAYDEMSGYYALWSLANAILSQGWAGAVVPALLSERFVSRDQESMLDRHRLRREIFARSKHATSTHVLDIVELLDGPPLTATGHSSGNVARTSYLPKLLRPRDFFRLTPKQQWQVLRAAVRDPRRATSFMMWHAKMRAQRFSQRLKNR